MGGSRDDKEGEVKIYKIKFQSFSGNCGFHVSDEGGNKIPCSHEGDIIAQGENLEDIAWLNNYGKGIYSIHDLGTLIQKEKYFKEG